MTTRVAVTVVTRVAGVMVVVTVDVLGIEVTVVVMNKADTEGGAVTVAAVTTDHSVTTKVDILAGAVTVSVKPDQAVTMKVEV